MGVWGFGVLDGDFQSDIYQDALSLLESGVVGAELESYLLEAWEGQFVSEYERAAFWIALASAMMERQCLSESVRHKAKSSAQSDAILDGFAAASDRTALRESLAAFVEELDSRPLAPPPPNKPRRKRHGPLGIKPGDCLCVTLPSGGYGASICTAIRKGKSDWIVRIGILWGKYADLPDAAVFEAREWIVEDRSSARSSLLADPWLPEDKVWLDRNLRDNADEPHHGWCYWQDMVANADAWKIVHVTKLRLTDPRPRLSKTVGELRTNFSSIVNMLENQNRLRSVART